MTERAFRSRVRVQPVDLARASLIIGQPDLDHLHARITLAIVSAAGALAADVGVHVDCTGSRLWLLFYAARFGLNAAAHWHALIAATSAS